MRATRSAADLLVGTRSRSAADLLVPGGGPSPGGSRPPSAGAVRRTTRAQTLFETSAREKHELAHGDHGLQWEDTIVTNVHGQARKKGIRPGWKIYMVDGNIVNNAQEVWMRLQTAKWQWRSCYVWFVTDMVAIRAEQARARAAKIQAETERLARLPFDGAHDTRHLDQIKEEFKFQGFIEKTEDRAITCDQLKRALNWAADHCHRWRDPYTRQKLQINVMTLYQLNHWLIRPATQEKNCSFVELVASQKQTPTWFVIHWWGETIADFLECVKVHVETRQLPESSGFWVSAYANRQHGLGDKLREELEDDLKKSTFYRAMAAARFQVLLTLDSNADFAGPATALTRIWCGFEGFLCLDEPGVLFDVAAVQGARPMLVTRGLTADEKDMEWRSPGSGHKAKEVRERTFDNGLIEACLSVKVQAGRATEPQDKQRLFNCLAGREADLAPLEESDHYEKVNRRLRAVFALTFWRRVMSVAAEDMKELQGKLAEVLRNDTWRDSLDLSFACCAGGMEKIGLVCRCLPPNLKDLKLDLKGMAILDENLTLLAGGLPPGLESLTLLLSHNPDISNVGVANFTANLPPRLRTQRLDLAATGVSKDFQEAAESLEGLKNAIYEEAQKGNLCTTVNLLPSATRRMTFNVVRSKCFT